MRNFPKPPIAPDLPFEKRTASGGNITTRDYFAAKAMQALIEKYDCEPVYETATEAYNYADAMLKAREAK